MISLDTLIAAKIRIWDTLISKISFEEKIIIYFKLIILACIEIRYNCEPNYDNN